ncbi:MAG: hypothetical protein QW511_03620 [Candidatus Methanomethylicia archaeon]
MADTTPVIDITAIFQQIFPYISMFLTLFLTIYLFKSFVSMFKEMGTL